MNIEPDRLDKSAYFIIDVDLVKEILDSNTISEKALKTKLEKMDGEVYARYFTTLSGAFNEYLEEPNVHNFGIIHSNKKYSVMIPEHVLSKMFEHNLIKEVVDESKIAYLLLLGIDTSFKGE